MMNFDHSFDEFLQSDEADSFETEVLEEVKTDVEEKFNAIAGDLLRLRYADTAAEVTERTNTFYNDLEAYVQARIADHAISSITEI